MDTQQGLSSKQQESAPIAAATAMGDMPQLNAALNSGLDAGLTVNDTKEILVQLYAYIGFPRSLNALGELMKVLDARKQRGIQDAPGRDPGPVPSGKELLAIGTANQTKLSGAPVKGPLFDFAPAIDEYLKSHLFGDIFARDNLDWQSRELATVGALAAMPGVESQLRSHHLKPGNDNSQGSVHDLNRLGSWLGAMAQSNGDQGPDATPIKSDLDTAAYLGQRVAETVRRLKPS